MAKSFERNRTLVRTWEVLSLIGASPRTVHQIAFTLAVTPRTVYRDLQALQEAGFPLYNERRDGVVHWHTMNPATTPKRVPDGLTSLQLRFSDAPQILKFVEQLHRDVSALYARLQQAAA